MIETMFGNIKLEGFFATGRGDTSCMWQKTSYYEAFRYGYGKTLTFTLDEVVYVKDESSMVMTQTHKDAPMYFQDLPLGATFRLSSAGPEICRRVGKDRYSIAGQILKMTANPAVEMVGQNIVQTECKKFGELTVGQLFGFSADFAKACQKLTITGFLLESQFYMLDVDTMVVVEKAEKLKVKLAGQLNNGDKFKLHPAEGQPWYVMQSAFVPRLLSDAHTDLAWTKDMAGKDWLIKVTNQVHVLDDDVKFFEEVKVGQEFEYDGRRFKKTQAVGTLNAVELGHYRLIAFSDKGNKVRVIS